MGRRPRTFQPNAVLQSAIYSGLAALARLARGRVRSKRKKHYRSIEKNWMEAWQEWETSRIHDPYDFSPIQNAEPNLRGAFFRILWQSTKRYGNKENKRVYSWREGTVGPLNSLLNYAGARLRDLALTHYLFPDPIYYEVRVYADGSTKIFPESLAEKYPDPSAVKTYTKAGYPGNQHGPRILLAHPTLPGLDFVDMIRAHLIELCKQCFIYNVPRTEAHRYIRLLIHRLRPYLDWVYTQGKTGKKHFNPESDKELREIVNEIKAFHGTHAGRRESVTKKIGEGQLPGTILEVKDEIKRQLDQTTDEDERKRIQEILDHIEQGTLQDRDAEKFRNQVLSLSQREGNDWHRILLSDLHHPVSLKQVVFAGDKMLEDSSPVLIVGEQPVGKRTGQIDITFFLSREVPGLTIMTPMLILEIKSKTGFNYNLYSVRTRNRKKKEYGPRLFAWKRRLTEDEWKTISKAKPLRDTMDQLDAYERILLREYKELVPSDPTTPERLWKGVVVLDTDQNPIDVFNAFQDLMKELTTALVNDLIESSSLTSYIPDPDSTLKLALLLTPSEGPAELIQQMSPPESTCEEDPFSDRVLDDRTLSLYVSIPSSTSSGNAAAQISKNWHLLHHIMECEERNGKQTQVFWLDLMGVLKEIEEETLENQPRESDEERTLLINSRFGLDKMLREKRIACKTHRRLTDFLKRIKFVDLSTEINAVLFENKSEFSEIIDTIQSKVSGGEDTEKIIVLDGWSEFRDLVSREHRALVKSLERTLLDVLPEKNTEIIWIDSGVSHTKMNPTYQRKCIRPLPYDSHRRSHLDEIIYNVPSTPRLFSWKTPRREDVRVIIQDTPTSVDPWSATIDVPLLRDFAKKVRGVSRRDGLVSKEDLVQPTHMGPMHRSGVTLSTMTTSMWPLTEDTVTQVRQGAMTLIPNILRLRENDDGEEEKPEQEKAEEEEEYSRYIEVEPISSPSKSLSLTKRLVLHPTHAPPTLPRAHEQYHEAKRITRGWCYDSFPEEEDEVTHPVCRPPLIDSSTSLVIDTATSRELELRRLLYAAQHLMKIMPSYEELFDCCERIVIRIESVLKKEKKDRTEQVLLKALRDVRFIIKKSSRREQVWEKLLPVRREFFTLLNSENRMALEDSLAKTPDVLELYGNNLFLTICVIMEELVPADQYLTMAVQLWTAVTQWVPYQLGFRTKGSEVCTRYDLQAIHDNLRRRARLLLDKIPAVQRQETHEHGQILWSEEEGLFEAWIIFQGEEEMVGGLVTGLQEPLLHSKWYDCVKDSKSQKLGARRALICTTYTPIVTHQHKDKTVLWIQYEDEEGEKFWMPYILGYSEVTAREKVLLPWIKLSDVPSTILSELQPPTQVEVPSYTGRKITRFLKLVIGTTQEPIRVTCHVSIDLEEELYQVDFYHQTKKVGTLKFGETYRLLRTLRHPIRIGSGLEISDGLFLMWDHKKDVEYQDVAIENEGGKETISLSMLRPLVHRSRFFPDEFFIPNTCSELLSTRQGNSLILVIHSADSSFKDLSVGVVGVPANSSLKALESVSMSIYDLALLTESEQLIDRGTMTRYSVDLDVKELFDLRFTKLSDYSILQSAIENLDESDHDWTREEWTVDIFAPPHLENQIRWSIRSRESGKTWRKKIFDYEMDYSLGIDEVISNFEERVSRIVPLKSVSGFSDTVARLTNILHSRGWREGKPRCRVDLEMRDREHVAVVSRMESGGELRRIAEFRIDVMEDTSVLYDRLLLDGGLLSYFDVVNSEEFFDAVSTATTDEAVKKENEGELDAEEELLKAIKEWREDDEHPFAKQNLGETLTHLSRHLLSMNRHSEALDAIKEAIGIFRECNSPVYPTRIPLTRALAVKAEVLLQEGGKDTMIESILQEAKALIQTMMSSKNKQDLSEWIDELTTRHSSL